MLSVVACLVIAAGAWWAAFAIYRRRVITGKRDDDAKDVPGLLHTIKPLQDFDWKTTKPQKIRPFKAVYHITMGVRPTEPSDLISIDKNYLSRIELRKATMAEHPEHVLGCLPTGAEAVREVYSYLLNDYLPARFPSMFSKSEKTFRNHVTQTSISLHPPSDPIEALKLLGGTVEDDLFLLQQTPDGHQCVGFLCTSPSGFDPAEKLGKLLKEVHGPVPAYEKIGPSMERFFGRTEVGKNATRVNWSVTTDPVIFNLGTNHVKDGDAISEDQEVDISRTRLRVELQTLSRLPRTRALLFSFKTLTYPIEEIKAEGLGPELAEAIEGLKVGNAPGMWRYKGGIRWGKSVCEFLRS